MVFALVPAALFISTISSTAVIVAFPQIISTYNVSLVLASWVLSVNLLATVVAAPLFGKASDFLGRKRMFVSFMMLFSIGSLVCAVAPNIYVLILARAIQGMGAGGLIPATTGIAAEMFPRSRQRAIGAITSMVTFGSVVGPTIGGWLTESYGWKSIFWFSLAWGFVVTVGCMVLMRPDGERRPFELDGKGVILFSASLVLVMVGVTTLGNRGEGVWPWLGGVAVVFGSALMVLFLRHEKVARTPVIDLEVFRSRPFVAANLFNAALGISVGVLTFIPLYAVTAYGMSTFWSGLALTPRSIGLLLASIVSTYFLNRWGYRRPMIAGWIVVLVAFLLIGLDSELRVLNLVQGREVGLLAVIGLSGIGLGIAVPAANNACIELLPDRVSTITGVRQTFRNLGAALGVAATSIVLHLSTDMKWGFTLAYAGTALLVVVSLPLIFAMPRSPDDCASGVPAAKPKSG